MNGSSANSVSTPTGSPNLQLAFHRILGSIKQLPSPPEVCLAVTRAAQADDTTLGEMQALVENDIALSARLMQVANSAFFGIREPVSSVRKAISMLGFNTVKALALGFFFNEEFGKLQLPGLPYPSLPRYALASSCIAESLADRIEPSRAPEASCLGLLHESGVMVMAMAFGNRYRSAVQQAQSSGQALHVIESERFGVNHAAAAQILFKNWQLSEALVKAVGFHHRDELPDGEPESIRQLWRIGRMAALLALGLFHEPDAALIEELTQCSHKHLRWTGADLAEVLVDSGRVYRQRACILQISPANVEADQGRSITFADALRGE